MFSVESFVGGINASRGFLNAGIDKGKLVIYEDREDQELPVRRSIINIPLSGLSKTLELLNNGYEFDGSALFSDLSYEVAIQSLNPRGSRLETRIRYREDNKLYDTKEHNYEFSVQRASKEYVIALSCFVNDNRGQLSLPHPIPIYNEQSETLEEFFKRYRIFTVKIKAPLAQKKEVFRKMVNAYLFNISYTGSESYAISSFMDENNYFHSHRRGSNGQLFPYRDYNANLTRYYYQAVATTIPFVQYLGFYHVAEYFFQSLSEDEVFSWIQDRITKPKFSPRKVEDIRALYKDLKKKMHDQREDGVWDEKKGLLLCLKKLVPNLQELEEDIRQLDPLALDYYKNTAVAFADGDTTIDFSKDKSQVYKEICNRVYSTRNSIVHSKDGEKQRYEPFIHDKDLSREVALIRAIAEEIIISQAKEIDYTPSSQS